MNNQKDFDLIVIGSGATGSCIALEASKRGLKVALFDAGDISSGTSCRSTKLLHGGVRYLELAFKKLDFSQLNLVKEALIERGHWLKQAPFLAHQIELAIPTKNCLSKAYFGSGLRFYDYLSGDKSIAQSKMLSKKDMLSLFPLLREETHGGVMYSDGQFDDARLNLLIALTAEKAGTEIHNYCKVVDFEYLRNRQLKGVITEDWNGKKQRWEAKAIVNATGIQCDLIRQQIDSNTDPRIIISRGVHVVIRENLCPLGKGILLPATEDGRVLFILPFYGQTLVGTTDMPCTIEQAHAPSKDEEDYLISHLKNLFPNSTNFEYSSSWAGGRPLLKPRNSKVSSQIVREHEIEILPCGLISAMGGKWTTCRKIALDTLKAIETVLGKKLLPKKEIHLVGASKEPSLTQSFLEKQSEDLRSKLPKSDLLEQQILHLQSKYGLNALEIIERYNAKQLEPISSIIPICNAEIIQDITYEHAKTPTDILARRNRLAMVNMEEASRLLPVIQNHLLNESLPAGELNLMK